MPPDAALANLAKVDHLVVLMQENRSFDHMLGYLSLEAGRADVDGLKPGLLNTYQGQDYHPRRLAATSFPADPCHEAACVDEQLSGNNGGFVQNFAEKCPLAGDPGLAMGYYGAEQVPVYNLLASEFCVCDRWFASVPGQTWPNRLYSLTGGSAGRRDNVRIPSYDLPAFVRQLDRRQVPWRWYHHGVVSLMQADSSYSPPFHRSIFPFEDPSAGSAGDFFTHAASGDLAPVSWIDPNFATFMNQPGPQNDDHPPADITAGQELVLRIYNALAGSPAWNQTLFLVVYDEHGGLYDHVVPGPAPDDDPGMRRYGCRVPAIAVSPWVGRGVACHTLFDHTSIIKSILLRWCAAADGSIPNMGQRVAQANHLGVLLTEAQPRPWEANDAHHDAVAQVSAWSAAQPPAASRRKGSGPAPGAAGPGGLADRTRGYTEFQQGIVDATALRQEQGALHVSERAFDARPDTLDFRDLMYVPTLVEVPSFMDVADYLKVGVPVLDQGREGACTGFGLATVANYLLRRRKVLPDDTPVSPWMLYNMARRYDEWPGEAYEGSSARGAMKGWYKQGVCPAASWPNGAVGDPTPEVLQEATARPLGAYYRVDHRDLVAMHSALAEVGVLYATASVHQGWQGVGPDGVIPPSPEVLGGHAFAIVAFNQQGFWIQNSWGTSWGMGGLGLLSYDDWLQSATDCWVARLGAPARVETAPGTALTHAADAGASPVHAVAALRPHIVDLANEGQLDPSGPFATSAADLRHIFQVDFPAATRDWPARRLLLYAHGGLVSEASAVQRVADTLGPLLRNEIYPVAFAWHSDAWSTVTDILRSALELRRPEGLLDSAKDFMLDRLDDALEPIARDLGGKVLWDEMKRNATLATESPTGGGRQAAGLVAELAAGDPRVEIHVVGHSAGSIFHAPLVQALAAAGCRIRTCTLWAPACTVALFKQAYLPAIRSGAIQQFALFTMTDPVEQDDQCADIYHKSLLYLVSNALEAQPHIPLVQDGVPILGLAKFVQADPALRLLFAGGNADWVQSPSVDGAPPESRSDARHHGDFDHDPVTLQATLARILGAAPRPVGYQFQRSPTGLRDARERLFRSR